MKKPQISLHDKETIVQIKNVYKSFASLNVLKGITLDLHKGENLAIMGRSGSGKSVLIKLIAGILSPDKGSIEVKKLVIDTLDAHSLQQLRLSMGFLFQGGALYDSMTVRQNLEFPLTRNKRDLSNLQIEEAIHDVLENVGLLDMINQMPGELSGGQRKRVGIARTLVLQPEIMLYDEPTAGLDPVTSTEINELINHVQAQYHTSSIIITHDLVCAKQTADRIALIEDGRFGKIGNFNEVFRAGNTEADRFYNYNFTTD